MQQLTASFVQLDNTPLIGRVVTLDLITAPEVSASWIASGDRISRTTDATGKVFYNDLFDAKYTMTLYGPSANTTLTLSLVSGSISGSEAANYVVA